jgi:hypothetical protein
MSVVAGTRSKQAYSRSRGVPRQSHQHGSIAAIVVFVLLLQPLCNMIVHLLVVLEPGDEEGRLWRLAEPLGLLCVHAVYGGADEQGTGTPDQASRVTLEFIWAVLVLGSVAALPLLAEGGLRGSGEASGACGGAAEAGSGGA